MSGRLIYGQDRASNTIHAVNCDTLGNIAVSDVNITSGSEDDLTTAAQVCIYARKDTTPTGLRALKVNNTGSLFVRNNEDTFQKSNGTFTVSPLSTGNSGGISAFGANTIGFAATSTNSTDPMELYVSNDNSVYYPTGVTGSNGRFYHNEANPAFNWYAIYQTDTTNSGHIVNYIVSEH